MCVFTPCSTLPGPGRERGSYHYRASALRLLATAEHSVKMARPGSYSGQHVPWWSRNSYTPSRLHK